MVQLVKQYGGERMVINSAADWGVSDPLKVPQTVRAMVEAGIPHSTITRIVWDNPVNFFRQSGRLDLNTSEDRPFIDQRQLWEGNSVLRGQPPVVDTSRDSYEPRSRS